MATALTILGMGLSFGGSWLLFYWGMPVKKYGNLFITPFAFGALIPKEGEREVPQEEARAVASSFGEHAHNLNKLGFAITAVGTFRQLIAVLLSRL